MASFKIQLNNVTATDWTNFQERILREQEITRSKILDAYFDQFEDVNLRVL